MSFSSGQSSLYRPVHAIMLDFEAGQSSWIGVVSTFHEIRAVQFNSLSLYSGDSSVWPHDPLPRPLIRAIRMYTGGCVSPVPPTGTRAFTGRGYLSRESSSPSSSHCATQMQNGLRCRTEGRSRSTREFSELVCQHLPLTNRQRVPRTS